MGDGHPKKKNGYTSLSTTTAKQPFTSRNNMQLWYAMFSVFLPSISRCPAIRDNITPKSVNVEGSPEARITQFLVQVARGRYVNANSDGEADMPFDARLLASGQHARAGLPGCTRRG